ncbi:hypothetical protein DFH06DRAFT_1111157, partial [Mycena polygramma]
MSLSTAKLGDYFLRIPKCEADGTNYSVYKNRFKYAADAAGLGEHLNESYVTPVAPTSMSSPPSQAELDAKVNYEKALKQYKSGEAIVKQAIACTIPDAMFLRFMKAKSAAELWKNVAGEFEKKSKMVTVDL